MTRDLSHPEGAAAPKRKVHGGQRLRIAKRVAVISPNPHVFLVLERLQGYFFFNITLLTLVFAQSV